MLSMGLLLLLFEPFDIDILTVTCFIYFTVSECFVRTTKFEPRK